MVPARYWAGVATHRELDTPILTGAGASRSGGASAAGRSARHSTAGPPARRPAAAARGWPRSAAGGWGPAVRSRSGEPRTTGSHWLWRCGAVPPLADLALRTGDLLAVVVDAEVVAGVALLGAVLAGGVAGQRPGEGDLVLAPGSFHVDHGCVAAIGQVLGGEQVPVLQPGVDCGQSQGAGAGGRHGWRRR